MKRIVLNNNWKVKINGFDEIFDTQIPSSVYNTLIENKKIDNPYYRDNEMKALPVMDGDFEYTLKFNADETFTNAKHQNICFYGIDTVADVVLNGELLQKTNNMHRTWDLDVTGKLKSENTLTVKIYSPTEYIKKAYESCFVDGSKDAMEGFPHLRKAHCMFGWDWGPRLPDAGIWRDVVLYTTDTPLIENVHILQHHENNRVNLELKAELKFEQNKQYSYKVLLTAPNGEITTYDSLREIVIEDPKLWWPNGYGEQPLYSLCVQLLQDNEVIDTWTKNIGLRTITVNTDKDEWGSKFEITVNNCSIFSMGADYIPEDNIFPTINKERTRVLLEDCVLANYNTVRVWGGGYYPDDYFFDLCDELGLLVWQDFMIACAVCELTEEFEATLHAELVDNIKRLRHHASLAVWCGNNEMEWQIGDNLWKTSKKQVADYLQMYEYMFKRIAKTYDPQRFYWPSSPSSGGYFDKANDPNHGDVHYWDVWHGLKPFSDYRNYYFRYASEFGFQSFPGIKTVKEFTNESDRNIFSYIMEKHQRNESANGRILTYLSDYFLYPNNFESLLYASQLLQAEAVKYGVEHWRRNRNRCMGAIYWQINDCWPVTSWASIDYYGRWKALHYFAKRFFAPVMISCCEEGTITQCTNVNAQHDIKEQSAMLNVANENMSDFSGTVKWALRDAHANIVKQGVYEINVEAMTSKWLEKLDFSDIDRHKYYFSYELVKDNVTLSDSTIVFCQPKHFDYKNPNLSAKTEGNYITICADAYAKSVEIDCEDTDILLSDNYFDMNAGTKTVEVLRGNTGKITLRSVYDIR